MTGVKVFRRVSAFAAALLAVAVINCTNATYEVFAASQLKGTVTADYLNVRKEPGTDKSIMEVLRKGESVEIVKTEKGWHQIKRGKNDYGWVCADYIKTNTDQSKTKTATENTYSEKTNGTVTVTGSYTNFRKGPGTGYSVIKRLYNGTTGSIIQKSGSWYKIKLNDSQVGWVNKKYVKVTGYKDTAVVNSTEKKIIVDVSTVNVRSTASKSGKLVATIRKNEVYAYSEVKNGWYKIVTPSGKSGYVNGNYVDKFTDYAVQGGGKYIWPTQTATRITTYFGTRNGRTHGGLDIAAPGGSQIMAIASGTVYKKKYTPDGLGHLIVIEQNDGIHAYYAHMQKESFLNVGDKVKAGDTIGIVGTTGRSTGNHLHLELRKGTERIDPLDFYPDLG